ncbi:MAG: DUF2339 domain-containing protein [Ignavibacteriales bacterium]|nr:DUF2339 domain-containing protein [Ignavibacteriales bacterium]
MDNNFEHIKFLQKKLDALSLKQDLFKNEIDQLKILVNNLAAAQDVKSEINVIKEEKKVIESEINPIQTQNIPSAPTIKIPIEKPKPIDNIIPKAVKSNVEKFIGENLINKIGIIVLIIGVGIGAKYAIDNKLISPLTRIILGYLVGISLLGFAIKLKKQYLNFSSVLLSGSMAIMYFITFFAFSFYGLIPELLTFILMVLFTAFTVLASINYNKQIIAHIGLVGAYFVPILLSDGSGRVEILFSYMAIINIGILAIGFLRYWKSLHYSSFVITWLIVLLWYFDTYSQTKHFSLALTFLSIFFITFYLSFLAYKIIKSEKFVIDDILLLLFNSFLYYGICYSILDYHPIGKQVLGLFTLGNALIHFIISIVVYKRKLADKNIFYFISGLVLVFITIAIPVQLDGNWVTMLWALQAALLFWIGRTKKVLVYEYLSYPLMVLAFISIIQDWNSANNFYSPEFANNTILPIFNIHFLTSIIFVGAFAFINYVKRSPNYSQPEKLNKDIAQIFSFLIPAVLIGVTYYAFFNEIQVYWNQIYIQTRISLKENRGLDYFNYVYNYDYEYLKGICLIDYSMLFVSILSILNIKKFKNRVLGNINLILGVVALLIFLIAGLWDLSLLRNSYLAQSNQYFQSEFINLLIRYISFGFVAVLLTSGYYLIKQDFANKKLFTPFDIILHSTIVWILSSEWIHWMDIAESTASYRLSLSIIWGLYSLLLIALGIWKKKKHLRLAAIVLFSITLLKLFLFDVSNLDTIPKTILFVSLGILLLIISFLYNRFKNLIFNEDENSNNK